jgi:cell division protein FtsW
MKLFVVLLCGDYTVRKAAFMDDFRKGFLPMFAVMTLIAALPAARARLRRAGRDHDDRDGDPLPGRAQLAPLRGPRGAARGAFVVLIISSPYRFQRIVGFMDPWSDAYGKGYQLSHSLIAFGRGEWLGVGLGASVEKLFYLPEAHTDFLLAVIAEELGFAAWRR